MHTPIRDIQSDCNGAVAWRPGRLWSLSDMISDAQKYVDLGEWLHGVRMSFMIYDTNRDDEHYKQNDEGRIKELKTALQKLGNCCEELGLSRATELVAGAYDDPPQSKREFDLLIRAVATDIRQTSFLYIPEHLAKYYDVTFPGTVTTAFPLASK